METRGRKPEPRIPILPAPEAEYNKNFFIAGWILPKKSTRRHRNRSPLPGESCSRSGESRSSSILKRHGQPASDYEYKGKNATYQAYFGQRNLAGQPYFGASTGESNDEFKVTQKEAYPRPAERGVRLGPGNRMQLNLESEQYQKGGQEETREMGELRKKEKISLTVDLAVNGEEGSKMPKYLTADTHSLFPLIARALIRRAKKEYGQRISFGLELVAIHRNEARLQKVDRITGGIEEIMSKILNFHEEIRCNTSHGWAYRNLAQKVYCLHVYDYKDKISSFVLLEFARIETDRQLLNDLTPDQMAWMTIERQTLKRKLDLFRSEDLRIARTNFQASDGGVDAEEMKTLKLNSILENAFESPAQLYVLAFFGAKAHSNLKIQELLSFQHSPGEHSGNLASPEVPLQGSRDSGEGVGGESVQEKQWTEGHSTRRSEREGRAEAEDKPPVVIEVNPPVVQSVDGGAVRGSLAVGVHNHSTEEQPPLSSSEARLTGGFLAEHEVWCREGRPSYCEHTLDKGEDKASKGGESDSEEVVAGGSGALWGSGDRRPAPARGKLSRSAAETKPVRRANDAATTAKRRTVKLADCSPPGRRREDEGDSSEEDSYIEGIFRRAGVDGKESRAISRPQKASVPAAKDALGLHSSPLLGSLAATAAESRREDEDELFQLPKARLVGLLHNLHDETSLLRRRLADQETAAFELKSELVRLVEKLLSSKTSKKELKQTLQATNQKLELETAEKQHLVQTLETQEKELEDTNSLNLRLQAENEKIRASLLKLQSAYDGLKTSQKEEKERAAEVRNDLTAQLSAAQAEKREVLSKLKSYEDALLRAREEAGKERIGAEKNILEATDYKRRFELTDSKRAELESRLRQIELEADKLRQELEVKNRHTLEFTLKQELKDAELGRLKQDLETSKTAISKLESAYQSAILDKTRLEERIKHQSELGQQNSDLVGQLQAQNQEILGLQNNLSAANGLLQERVTEIGSLKQRLSKQEKTKRQCSELKAQVNELKGLLAEAEDRIEKISLEFLTLKSMTEEKRGEADTLRQRLEFMSQEKEQWNKVAEEQKKKESELQSELREAMSERGVQRQEFEAANQRVKAARIENNRLRKENEDVGVILLIRFHKGWFTLKTS